MTLKRIMTALTLLGVVSLAACNTAEGFGEDMQDAGKAIEDQAET